MFDITQIINQSGKGALLIEINDTLGKLITDCVDTGKKGAMQIAIVVEPMATRDGGHQVKIIPNVTSKNPRYDAGPTVFFVVTDDKNKPVSLEHEDPRQMAMFAEVGTRKEVTE